MKGEVCVCVRLREKKAETADVVMRIHTMCSEISKKVLWNMYDNFNNNSSLCQSSM